MSESETFFQSLLRLLRGEEKSTVTGIAQSSSPIAESNEVEKPYQDSGYKEYPELVQIRNMRPGNVHVHGKFQTVMAHRAKQGLLVTNGNFHDNTGSVSVVWFRANVAPVIRRDTLYELRGKLEFKGGKFQINSPDFRKLSDGCAPFEAKNITPKARPTPVIHHNKWEKVIEGKGVDPTSEWGKLRIKIFQRDNYSCVECGATEQLTVDHKLELSLGGTNAISNLQTLCKDCHEDKHYRNFLDRNFDAVDDYGKNYEPTVKIKALSSAKKKGSFVRINYVDRHGAQTTRTIHPKHLYKGFRRSDGQIVNVNKVYVDAFCELDNDRRTFRVSRMTIVG